MAPIGSEEDFNDDTTNQSGNLKPRKAALHRNVVRRHYQVKIPSSMKRPKESKQLVPFHSQGKDLGAADEDAKDTSKNLATQVYGERLDRNGTKKTASTPLNDKASKSLDKTGGLHVTHFDRHVKFQNLYEDVIQERLRDESQGKALLNEVTHANLAHEKCAARSSQIEQASVISCSMKPFIEEKPQLSSKQELDIVQLTDIPRKRRKVHGEGTTPQRLLLGARSVKNDQEVIPVDKFDRECPNRGKLENQDSKALSRKLSASDVNAKPSWVHGMKEVSCQLELDLTADLPFSPNPPGIVASESVSRMNQMTEGSTIQTSGTFCTRSHSSHEVKSVNECLDDDRIKHDASTVNEIKHVSTALSVSRKSMSMLEQLEFSLQERDCARAMEVFIAWKREDFKVEPRRNEKLGKERSDQEMLQDIPGKKRGFIVSLDISRGL